MPKLLRTCFQVTLVAQISSILIHIMATERQGKNVIHYIGKAGNLSVSTPLTKER